MMSPKFVRGLVAVALVVGCSKSSTAPNASVSGSWQVTWVGVPAGTTISQSSDTLAIGQSGSGYTLSYTDIIYTVSVSTFYVYDNLASGSSFSVSGNNVIWRAGDASTAGCYLAMNGTVSGATMSGTAAQGGSAGCPTRTWSWVATKI